MSITIKSKRGASLTVGNARITKKLKSPSGALLDVPVKGLRGPKVPAEKSLQEFGRELPDGSMVTWDSETTPSFPGLDEVERAHWLIDEDGQQVRSICARAGGPRPKISAGTVFHGKGDPRKGDGLQQLPEKMGQQWIVEAPFPDPDPMSPQSGPQGTDPTSDRLKRELPGAPQINPTPAHPPIGFDAVAPKADPTFRSQVRPPMSGVVSKDQLAADRKRSEDMAAEAHRRGKLAQDSPPETEVVGSRDQSGFAHRRCRICGDGFTTMSPTRSACDAHVGSLKRQ